MCSELPFSCLSSFAFVDLGSVQKVALAVQELNGRFFHERKLYVNSNRSCPKRTPDAAERPRELPVRVPPLRAPCPDRGPPGFLFILFQSGLTVEEAGAWMKSGHLYDL